ncbi:MAG: hypothetical protein ACRERC_09885 [Candidatus Binatia bacterium]
MGRGRTAAQALAALAIIATACLLHWGDSVGAFFFLDDYWLLQTSAAIRGDGISDLWQVFVPSHVGFLLYRPLTQAGYFVALGHLFGVDAAAYHAVHLLAAIANVMLAFGLAWRLTRSWFAGLATALLFAAAPGLIVAVFWIAAFTMTGSAMALLLLLWCWLASRGWARRVGCTLLQAVALLASEHAVVGPLLLALLEWATPERRRWRDLLGPAALVAAYLLAKAIYFATTGLPGGGYALSLDPRVWITSLGYYAAACLNLLTLNVASPQGWTRLGVAVLLIALATAVAGLRAPRWRVAAAGWGVFIVALLPVLPLADHRYAYFIGLAGVGAWLAVVATLQQLGRVWRPLVLVLYAAVLITDWSTEEAAARDSIFHLVVKGGRAAGLWYAAVDAAGRDPSTQAIFVPRTPTTEIVFDRDQRARLFMQRAMPVVLYSQPELPPLPAGIAVVAFAPDELPPGYAWPGSGGRWHWVFELLAAPRRALSEALRPAGAPVGTDAASR